MKKNINRDREKAPANIKLVAFDMDGTLTTVRSSWEYVHRRFNLWDHRAVHYQQQFWAGKICYAEFCRLDAALWRGLPLSQLRAVINEIPLHPLAGSLLTALRKKGIKIALLSSGLDLLAARIATEFKFDYWAANGLAATNGVLTGEPVINVSIDEEGRLKRDHLLRLQRSLGLSAAETAAIGDSIGDADMFSAAALPILLSNDPAEQVAVKQRVPHVKVVPDLAAAAALLQAELEQHQEQIAVETSSQRVMPAASY